MCYSVIAPTRKKGLTESSLNLVLLFIFIIKLSLLYYKFAFTSHSGLLDPAGGGRGGHRGHVLAARVAAARREADLRGAAQPPGDADDDGGVGGRERSRTLGYSGESQLA